MLRKFQKKGGFNPKSTTTKFIVYDSGKDHCYCELRDGSKVVTKNYDLKTCLHFVTTGDWIEIKQDGEKCSGCSCEGRSDKWVDLRMFHLSRRPQIIIDMSAKIKPEPIDFSTAQVGDTVRCILNGDVKVAKNDGTEHPIKLVGGEWIYPDGKACEHHINPQIIGFVDTDGKLCRTRPEPKIDWSKVAIDAPVEVTTRTGHSINLYLAKIDGDGDPIFFMNGSTSITCDHRRQGFRDATYKLINTEGK